jgi:hypothetical protein
MPYEQDTLQSDADNFIALAQAQGLEINSTKCQIIHFHLPRSPCPTPPPVLLQSIALLPETNLKILGVWFSSDLKWRTHLQYLYKKCARASYLVKMLYLRGIKGVMLRSICEALVYSHLMYCWPVFCDSNLGDLNPILNLEKRLSKLCNSPINAHGLRAHLDTQCERLALRISKIDGHPLEECFLQNPSISSVQLRRKRKFVPLKAKYAQLRNSFSKFSC